MPLAFLHPVMVGLSKKRNTSIHLFKTGMFIDSEMVQLFCTDAHPSLVSKESSAIEVTVLLLDDI